MVWVGLMILLNYLLDLYKNRIDIKDKFRDIVLRDLSENGARREPAIVRFLNALVKVAHNLDLYDAAYSCLKFMVIEGKYQGIPDLPFPTDEPYYHQSMRRFVTGIPLLWEIEIKSLKEDI